MAALGYQFLKSHSLANRIEKEAFNRLKIAYLSTSAQNSYYQQELKQILGAFMKDGIPVIPLKGIILSQRLYGDITSRDQSVDFDLLVKEEAKEEAKSLLERLGYCFRGSDEIKQWQWAYVFNKPPQKMIELHWDITMMGRSEERIRGLWQGSEIVDWEGIKYHDFKPEELLLYLSAHLVNSDSFRTLRAPCDIERLLEKYGSTINWQRLVAKARQWQLRYSLYTGLVLNKDLFGYNFPPQILKMLKVSLPKRLFIKIFAARSVVLRGGLRRKILDKFLAYTFFELIEASSLREYAAIFKRVFLPPKEAMSGRSYILRIFKGIKALLGN